MPVGPAFSGDSFAASAVSTAFPGLTTGDVRFLSARVDDTSNTGALSQNSNFVYCNLPLGSIPAVTPAKMNTRSQAATSTYGQGNIQGGGTAHLAWQIKTCNMMRAVWTPGVRWRPVAIGVDTNNESLSSQNGTLGVIAVAFIENTPLPSTKLTRRSSRKGAWWRMGNDINFGQKTGSGAFFLRFPVFEANIVGIDGSAWGLGHQNPINLPLLTATVARRRAGVF